MAEPARKREFTYADYLELEQETGVRHEFVDGEAFAMAGGTPRHSKLKTNLVRHVGNGLDRGPCQPYDSDLKIRVPDTGLASYPDLAVICGPILRDEEDRNAVTNPTLLAEVLSPSTEGWDRGGKFSHLQRLPTLRHYVLVSADTQQVEHFERQADGSWRYTRHTEGEVAFSDLGFSLSLADLYANLPEDEIEQLASPQPPRG